jgi:hypothetical protein
MWIYLDSHEFVQLFMFGLICIQCHLFYLDSNWESTLAAISVHCMAGRQGCRGSVSENDKILVPKL